MERFFAVIALCVSLPAWSQQRCAPNHIDVPKERASVTANSGANLSKSPESLRAQLSRLLGTLESRSRRPGRRVARRVRPVAALSDDPLTL